LFFSCEVQNIEIIQRFSVAIVILTVKILPFTGILITLRRVINNMKERKTAMDRKIFDYTVMHLVYGFAVGTFSVFGLANPLKDLAKKSTPARDYYNLYND
jgi:uncharacterized membrane protein